MRWPSFFAGFGGFGPWGVGFRVWGLGFRVWGLGFRAWGLGFRVWGFSSEWTVAFPDIPWSPIDSRNEHSTSFRHIVFFSCGCRTAKILQPTALQVLMRRACRWRGIIVLMRVCVSSFGDLFAPSHEDAQRTTWNSPSPVDARFSVIPTSVRSTIVSVRH